MSSKTEYESYLTGVGEARERIIKLLEEARSVFVEDTVSYGTMTGLIALIKGEK